MHLVQELLNKVQWWCKKFCKADKSLEAEEHSGHTLKVYNVHDRSHYRSWSSYNYTRSCPRIQYWHSIFNAILQPVGIWSKLERWKGSISGCLTSWLKNQKKSLLWSVIIFCFTQQWTISPSNCDLWQKVDFIRQLVMTSSMAGPRSSSKALPKAKLAPNKRTWSLVVCCKSDLLYLSEAQQNHYIWEAGSANRWHTSKTAMPAASTDQRKDPILHDNARLHNQCFQSWRN